jgi:hypothetical protein
MPRDKTSGDKTSRDKTSRDLMSKDITSVGQKIQRDKTSGRTKRLKGQNVQMEKCPEGQNVPRDLTSLKQNVLLGYFLRRYIFKSYLKVKKQ